MYNGIGLSTVRGSGTSGYVQANAFNRHKKGLNRPSRDGGDDARHGNRKQGPNADVLAHNRKREFELRVFEYRVGLEDEGLAEDEIDKRVDVFRAKLVEEEEKEQGVMNVSKGGGTHEAAARKQHDMQKLQEAFGVGGYEEGAAFTKEYHERRKQEREQERLARQRAREEEREEEEREEERRREEREAGERVRERLGAEDLDEEKRARERALDAELDAYREEERDLNGSNRQASGSDGGSDVEEEDSGSEDEDEDEGDAPRKRARHDTDSEHEEERYVGDGGQGEKEQGQVEECADQSSGDDRDEDVAGDPVPAPAVPASAPEALPGKVLEDVILALFAEKDVLRKKEIVAAAEDAEVEFQDGEYSKLMRKLATSQPGGKWKRKE